MDRSGANQTRLTDEPASDESPGWAPRKLGVEVSQGSVVFPNASTLLELGAQEVSSGVGAVEDGSENGQQMPPQKDHGYPVNREHQRNAKIVTMRACERVISR